jgi:FlaA1/EpsC-like NDP-sugar epimerase
MAKSTLIYGAGEAGVRLFESLRIDNRFKLDGFIDDKASLQGRTLMGLPIFSSSKISDLIDRFDVSQILLAMPSISRRRRFEISRELSKFGLKVLETPSLAQIASGERSVSDLSEVSISALLGRDSSRPDPELLKSAVFQEVVLVTGAGGSIGSALCRTIIDALPRALILFERNEYALYSINRELRSLARLRGVELISVLGDVGNQKFVESVLSLHRVTVLLHSAAYKHVPLVESNVCAGLSNNILGTRSVLDAALSCGLKKFTLISTDKAVRPTNAMGASKRVCELLVQAASDQCVSDAGRTVCSMVRFGNVLGSSGSVVPLFQEQIEGGGPITLTHFDITRYFMTIQEAALLVLQSTGMASGGEVFVLDMGEPVRLYDLAKHMIALSGCTLRDEDNPNGDIEIQVTGLRPGEKLFEELLISDNDMSTRHPLIRKARERSLSSHELMPLIDLMVSALDAFDSSLALDVLRRLVPEYQPNSSRK